MAKDPEAFEVDELDDAALESVSGGAESDENYKCTENNNCAGANCIANCGGGGSNPS